MALSFFAFSCKKDTPYTSATVIRPTGSNCANYLLSINGTTYATYSIPYKDTAVGSTFFLSYVVGGTSSGGTIDSVQCYLSGTPIHYPYIEITKIYE